MSLGPNFDRWLTTDYVGEAQEAAADKLDALWCIEVDAHNLPYEACEDDHPQHAIYEAWLAFVVLADEYAQRLEAEAEAAFYEDDQS